MPESNLTTGNRLRQKLQPLGFPCSVAAYYIKHANCKRSLKYQAFNTKCKNNGDNLRYDNLILKTS